MQATSAKVLDSAAVPAVTADDTPSVDPDAELVDRWQAGDMTAFETLVTRHTVTGYLRQINWLIRWPPRTSSC